MPKDPVPKTAPTAAGKKTREVANAAFHPTRREPAPNHQGKPNSRGELYPGFPKADPKYCEACEHLRRGLQHATKPHRSEDGLYALNFLDLGLLKLGLRV